MSVRAVTRRLLAGALIASALVGCSGLVEGKPTPTPQDFGGIVSVLSDSGISVTNPKSGDAGCPNPNLIPTAIAFEATGPGVTAPLPLRIYIFGDPAAFDRRRADVDACFGVWATDPATFETIDASPYVLAGQGPWPAAFKAALRAALLRAAGNG